MTTYKVNGLKAMFSPGYVLMLTNEQAANRMHALEFVKGEKDGNKKTYKVTGHIEFKAGEEITVLDGEVNKAFLEQVEDKADKTKANKRASGKATKKQKPAADKAPKDGGLSAVLTGNQ